MSTVRTLIYLQLPQQSTVIEIPDLDRPVLASGQQSPVCRIKCHGGNFTILVTVGELDHFLSCLQIPYTHHRVVGCTDNLVKGGFGITQTVLITLA